MYCANCNKELTEYEAHGFWNENPWLKLCIHCLLEKTPVEQRPILKKKIEKSLEKWEIRHLKY
jgi:hypothetical protein